MSITNWWLTALTSTGVLLLLAGCSSSTPEPAVPASAVESGDDADHHDHSGHDHDDHDHADHDHGDGKKTMTAEAPASADVIVPDESATVSMTPTPVAEVPAEPDQAVMAVLTGLKEGKSVVLWDFLPASYQADVQSVIAESAAQSDPEMHKKVFGTLQKLVSVLKTKKDFILANPLLQQPGMPVAELESNWERMVGMLGAIVNSELADPEKLKTLEARGFLDTTGDKLLSDVIALAATSDENPIAKLNDVQVTVIESGDEKAVVEITAPDEEPKQVAMVKVEGKWISEDIQTGWKDKVQEMREQIAGASSGSNEAQKQQLLSMLAMVDQSLDGLSAAEDEQQFNQQMQMLMGMAMGAIMSMQPTADPLTTPDVPSVDIIFKAELTDEEQDALFDKLSAKVDNTDNMLYSSAPLGDRTLITIGPVKDIEAFAKKLDIGKVTKVDVESKTITIEREE